MLNHFSHEVTMTASGSARGFGGWLDGALTANGYRVLRSVDGLTWAVSQDPQTNQEPWPLAHDWVPDLSDDGTVGCLERLLGARFVGWEAVNKMLTVTRETPIWFDTRHYRAESKGEALVMAAKDHGRWEGGL